MAGWRGKTVRVMSDWKEWIRTTGEAMDVAGVRGGYAHETYRTYRQALEVELEGRWPWSHSRRTT